MADESCYSVTDSKALLQGDIIPQCPLFVYPDEINLEKEIELEPDAFDVIILTQSCDLANDKVVNILVAPISTLTVFRERNLDITDSHIGSIRVDKQFRFCMLRQCPYGDYKGEELVIDFNKVFSVPKAILKAIVDDLDERIQVNSPFREYVAQRFGFFIMRVALPD